MNHTQKHFIKVIRNLLAGFCNFQSRSIPSQFGSLGNSLIKLFYVQGYSSVANLLRGTSQSEPFYGRPIANYVTTPDRLQKTKKKYLDLLKKDLRKVRESIDSYERVGADYRFELSLTTNVIDDRFFSELRSFTTNFERKCKGVVVSYGYLVPSTLFPGVVNTYTQSIYHLLEQHLLWVGSSLSIEQKELVVLLESLVIVY